MPSVEFLLAWVAAYVLLMGLCLPKSARLRHSIFDLIFIPIIPLLENPLFSEHARDAIMAGWLGFVVAAVAALLCCAAYGGFA